jgi:DNA-binding NtrC family response regulator
MARIEALSADLLFGSRLQAMAIADGHELRLAQNASSLEQAVREGDTSAVLVDLTDEDLDGSAVLEALTGQGLLEGIPALGYYSHVDVAARERAEQAGFDLIVPRSRMAREGSELLRGLLAKRL